MVWQWRLAIAVVVVAVVVVVVDADGRCLFEVESEEVGIAVVDVDVTKNRSANYIENVDDPLPPSPPRRSRQRTSADDKTQVNLQNCDDEHTFNLFFFQRRSLGHRLAC